MKQDPTELLGHGLTVVSVGLGASNRPGWFDFINTNAPGIGVILSAFFGFAGLFFYYINWKKSKLSEENKINLDKHIQETKSQFDKIDSD